MSRTASLCPTNRSGRIASWAAKPWRSSIELHTILPSNRLPNRLIPTNAQSWDYDAVGNWDSVTTNSTTQTRGSNRQNEITSVSGATTPTYDNNGNLTKDENDNRFVWDAWNREVKIKNSSNTVIATNAYDALNHKVQVTTSAGLIDKIFGKNEWQVFEEKNGSNTLNRYVWSPVYVDGLVIRDRDTDANGTLDERLFALQDANWNVTGITNTSGTIQERYTEKPYGVVTFRDGSGSTISVSTKGWDILHQGAKTDIIGDYDFRNRVYSPTLGRWLSNDPIGFESGDLNMYRYLLNRPLQLVDPTGENPMNSCKGCGPDIGISLNLMENRVRAILLIMDTTKKKNACSTIFATAGWDIPILAGSGPTVEGCPSDEKCKRTVTIDGKCYDSHAVNYYLFGLLNKLCGFGYAKGGAAVVGWSNYKYGHSPGAKSVWYCKGFFGRSSPACNWQPDQSRKDCEPCTKPYPGRLPCHFGNSPKITVPGE